MALFDPRPVFENMLRLVRLIWSEIRPIRSDQLRADMQNSKFDGWHEWERPDPDHFLQKDYYLDDTKEPLWLRNLRRYNVEQIEQMRRRDREYQNAKEDSKKDSEVELRPSAYKRSLTEKRRKQKRKERRKREYKRFWKKSGFWKVSRKKEDMYREKENIPLSQQTTQPIKRRSLSIEPPLSQLR